MNPQYPSLRLRIAVFTATLFLSVPLAAQENAELLVELINRMGALEAENRELRGQFEEARHEISMLSQRMDTLSADVDYRLNTPSDKETVPPPALEGEAIAPKAAFTPIETYEKARALLEQGDYEGAEQAFAAFVVAHPKDKNAGAAQYWLGVTYFVRGQHEKAVAAFAKGYKTYPKSSKAADNLLKLAKSLAALDRKTDACTTLDQLSSEHPKAHVKEVAKERKTLGCP